MRRALESKDRERSGTVMKKERTSITTIGQFIRKMNSRSRYRQETVG